MVAGEAAVVAMRPEEVRGGESVPGCDGRKKDQGPGTRDQG